MGSPIERFRFLESFKFMSSSLDGLVNNLKKEQMIHTQQFFLEDKVDLIIRKGVYPYDFMNSWEAFNGKVLPLEGDFYSHLNKCNISDDEY
jgi:hypothetical protein